MLDWHGSGLHATAFNNALSVFFPVGETFFIHAVKNYRHVVPAGSSLEKEVQAFIEQEAVHSREHVAYNKALEPYYFVAFIEGVVWCVLWPFERIPFIALAGTVALEHLTASLGHILVSDEHLARGSQPHFAQLWYWHAVEETEHKGVWGAKPKYPSSRSRWASTTHTHTQHPPSHPHPHTISIMRSCGL